MLMGVARGMQAMEEASPPILHRDLKPSNVFIDAGNQARVADMGLARQWTIEVHPAPGPVPPIIRMLAWCCQTLKLETCRCTQPGTVSKPHYMARWCLLVCAD